MRGPDLTTVADAKLLQNGVNSIDRTLSPQTAAAYSRSMNNVFRILFASSIIALAYPQSAGAQMMGHKPPVPMSPQQFAQAVAGQNVQIAVRVTAVKRNTLSAQLLQHETDSRSRATATRVILYYADGTPVVMGTARDIVPGAVLFVYGIVTRAGHVDVKQAVIDTRFVKVE